MKVCILDCDDAKSWSPISFGDMFRDFIVGDGDECLIVNIAREKALPNDVLSYDVIVVTGSRFNCRDGPKLEWFEPLCDVVRQAAAMGYPRIYAGCFGCQMVGHALGGIVDYNPCKGLVLKAEDIKLDLRIAREVFGNHRTEAETESDGANDNPTIPSSLLIIESHGDCVHKLPEGAELMATSASCAIEMFVAGKNRNILACQGHPEFELQYAVLDRIWPQVVEERHRLVEEEAEASKKTFDGYDGKDALVLRRLIAQFLRS